MGAKKGIKILLISFIVIIRLSSLYGGEVAKGAGIKIEGEWIRSSRGQVPVSAGYMTIFNSTDKGIKLVGVEAYPEGVCKAVELHEMRDSGGMMRMRRVESIVVPKREGGKAGRVELKPGGYHIMFMGIEKGYFETGKKIKLKLKFRGHMDMELEVGVKPSSGE